MTCRSCGATNPDSARFCANCGAPQERSGGRERRRVSVVFIDLAAFSILTHGFDPEELRDLADEVLTVVAGVIEDYDGFVDAFRGDGLIALFGAPRSHPDDPQRAVLAAAAGLRAIESIGGSRGFPLKGRAGVNTGIVIAGSVGSGRVRDYTVMGSTVNLAARLEAAAAPGEVWVGPETYESTRHQLLYEITPPVKLAGFPNVDRAYRLVSTLESHDIDPYVHLGFVGRQEELAELGARYRRVLERRAAEELWVVGEAGSGKTRLIREFLRSMEDRGPRAVQIVGKPTEGYSWEPLGRQLLGLQEGEEPRVRLQKVSQALSRLLPHEPRWHHYILTSLELAASGSWTRLERRAVDRTNLAWRDLLLAVARESENGLVLVVENNPQDQALLEFLELLRGAEAPLLVLRTSRGRRVPEGVDTLRLQPLGLDESLALLDQLASPIMRVATESLVFQVGGIPSYILELGRALSITQSGSFSGSLASLLQARLDMLELNERQMLSVAAVSGERSWEGLVLELSQTAGERELEKLIDEKILIQESVSSIPGQVELRFQSELLRHAVLRMIPFGDRPRLHLQVASWLEKQAPLGLSELIGNHFREGGSHDAAYPHFLAAADLAASQGSPRFEELFEALLELEVPADLLAQGSLAFAKAALDAGKRTLARRQLEAAEGWIAASPEESRGELRAARNRLLEDLAADGEALTATDEASDEDERPDERAFEA